MAQRVDVQYVNFYTQGSTARKLIPAQKMHTTALPKMKKRKIQRIYIDPVAILGTAVAVCMMIMMFVGVSQLQKEQQKTDVIQQKVQQLSYENRQLQAEYAVQCDLEAVEKTALALGMVPQEEVPHIAISVELPQEQEAITLWQRIGTFLTGLFA